MFITTAIALLAGAHAQAQKIDYKIEVRNDRGVMASPRLRVLDKQTGEIDIKKMPWEFDMKVTPELADTEITNTVAIKIIDAEKKMKKKPYTERFTQSTYRAKNGQAVYYLFTPDRQGLLQQNGDLNEPLARPIMHGEILITVTTRAEK